jgi:hypothetical protein
MSIHGAIVASLSASRSEMDQARARESAGAA